MSCNRRAPNIPSKATGRVLRDETAKLVLGYAAGFRDTRNLEEGGGGRNVGIEPTRRGRRRDRPEPWRKDLLLPANGNYLLPGPQALLMWVLET